MNWDKLKENLKAKLDGAEIESCTYDKDRWVFTFTGVNGKVASVPANQMPGYAEAFTKAFLDAGCIVASRSDHGEWTRRGPA